MHNPVSHDMEYALSLRVKHWMLCFPPRTAVNGRLVGMDE